MKKYFFIGIGFIFLFGVMFGIFLSNKTGKEEVYYVNTEHTDVIHLVAPKVNATATNPILVTGEARGSWFFEASFPIELLDAYGQVIGRAIAQAQGEWMTEAFVPFSASLTFTPPETDSGMLVLRRDNPSGLSEHDKEIRIPVMFDTTKNPKRKVLLYYYDQEKDKDEQGNILCSEKGLVSVERFIPVTMSPIQNTLLLFLRGALTDEEKKRGITTEYPLDGVSIEDLSFMDGKLIITLNDPYVKTMGGSCRVSILRNQMEKTVKQFENVKQVIFKPDTIFQP